MSDERRVPESAPNPAPKVRSPGAIRKLVLCALAAAPIACGPSNTGTQRPQPDSDAAVAVPAYGIAVPVDPGPSAPDYAVEMPPGVEEYAVVQPPDDPPVMALYAVPAPPPEDQGPVGAYGAPMPRE
jgi:hypothetical protein